MNFFIVFIIHIIRFSKSKHLILFAAILYSCIFSGCSGIKAVQIKDISNIKSVNTLSNPELSFDLTVENPNNFDITISKVNLDLFNDETKLVGINLTEKTKVYSQKDVSLPLIMKPSVETISKLLKSEFDNLVRGKVNQKMEIRGELVMKKFIFSKRIKIKEAVRF